MLFPEGSAEEYLGSVRAAATRRTSEKLYKHLVKRGSGYEVSLEEELPGSRVLWGELLMAGFVEKGDSGGRDRELYQRFHDGCLHPMAQEGYLLTYAQPYNLPPTIAFQPLRSQGSSHSLAGASSVSPQGSTSPVSRSASREPSPTGVTSIIDVEAHLRMTIGQFHDNGEGSIQKTVEEPVCSENESKNTPHHNVRRRTHDTRTWSSNQEHFEGPSMYTKSHRRLLSAIGRSAAAVRMWDHRGLCDVEARNCSVLWSSRLAALFTALAALDDVDGGAWCEQCEGLLALLRTSFPWQLRYLLRCMKRYEDVEALYGSLVQGQAAFYQNGDALVGAYYGHMANGVGYASERQEQADANRLTQILAGWLTDARIHHFLEWFPHIRLHQLIFTAIMQLAPRSGAEPMDRGILELFSESAVSFMLNSAMHVLDDVCESARIQLDAYTPRGVHFTYRLNLRLHHLRCMVEDYVKVVSSMASQVDESTAEHFSAVVAPFLGHAALYRWLVSMNFGGWSGEEQRMHCRMAAFLMYLVALNHQHPFLRSEDIRYLRKFHALPWLSVLSFCCRDPVTNHLVGPLTSALVQCVGEGALLPLVTGETLLTTMNRAIADATASRAAIYGNRELQIASIEPAERQTVYTPLRIWWPKIMIKVLNQNVRRMSVAPMIYYSVVHMMPVIWSGLRDHSELRGEGHNRFPRRPGFKRVLEWRWVVYHLNILYSMEPTLFDSALLDTIIYNFVLTKEQAFTGHPRNPLMLFCSEAKVLELQAYISSNYVALHQNPINVLLRMTSKALLSSFVLRPFCNLLLQLFHSLYKYVCYGFATFTMHRRTNLDPTHINALQESAAVNVVLELLHQPIPRGVEMNVSSFIRSLTSKTTFTDEVITNSGLPPNPLLSSVDLRVAEERALERVGERFLAAAETLMKTSSGSAPNVVDGVTFSQQEGAEKLPCLRPYSAGDVATYHLYNVLLQLFEMPELSKAPANLEEDSNAQCLARVINAYWRCLQCGSTSSLVLDFIKSSISIVLRLHYLCPWMVTKSTEQLQSWMHAERGKEPELQEFANTIINSLRQIYHDLMEMEKLDEAELTRDAAKGK